MDLNWVGGQSPPNPQTRQKKEGRNLPETLRSKRRWGGGTSRRETEGRGNVPRFSGDGPSAHRGPGDGRLAHRGPGDGRSAHRGPGDGRSAHPGPGDGRSAHRGPGDGRSAHPGLGTARQHTRQGPGVQSGCRLTPPGTDTLGQRCGESQPRST